VYAPHDPVPVIHYYAYFTTGIVPSADAVEAIQAGVWSELRTMEAFARQIAELEREYAGDFQAQHLRVCEPPEVPSVCTDYVFAYLMGEQAAAELERSPSLLIAAPNRCVDDPLGLAVGCAAAAAFAQLDGVIVHDWFARRRFDPDRSPALHGLRHAIQVVADGDRGTLETFGMVKFGLPELVCRVRPVAPRLVHATAGHLVRCRREQSRAGEPEQLLLGTPTLDDLVEWYGPDDIGGPLDHRIELELDADGQIEIR
jgi:hypothetical protein